MKKILFIALFGYFVLFPVFSEDYERVETSVGLVYTGNVVLPLSVPVDMDPDYWVEDITYKDYSSSLSSIGFFYSSDYFVKDTVGYSYVSTVLFHTNATETLDNNMVNVSDFDLRFGATLGMNFMFSNYISEHLRLVIKPGAQLFFTCYDTKNRNYSEMFLGIGPYLNISIKSYTKDFIYNFGLITSYNIGYLSTNAAELTQYDPVNASNIAISPYFSIGFNR